MPQPSIPLFKIAAESVGKRFGSAWVIRDFTDSFSSGEVVGVRGRNGSGKSTLLRMLCGQLTPSRGVIGWELAGSPVEVANVFEQVSWTGPYTEVVEELTVEEMLAFHFGLKPLREGITVPDIPGILELTAARNRPLQECSSGMRQRLLLGTALLAATPLLLLDEPTITLDAEARTWFQEQLAGAKVGRLTVIASNDEEDLEQCTRIISLG